MSDKIQKIGDFSLIESGDDARNTKCIGASDGILLLEQFPKNTGIRVTPTKITVVAGQTKDNPNYVVSTTNELPVLFPSMPKLSHVLSSVERLAGGYKKIPIGNSLENLEQIFALAGKPVPPIRKSWGLKFQELFYQ